MTTSTDLTLGGFFSICGGSPLPGKTVEAAWSTLDVGASTNTVSFGLFGYDITCLVSMCAGADDRTGVCAGLEARGIDGLAFGAFLAHKTANTISFGFHNEETSDNII